MKDAVKQTGCLEGLISACCNNQRTHTGGYKWKYGSYKRKLSNNYKKESNHVHPPLWNNRLQRLTPVNLMQSFVISVASVIVKLSVWIVSLQIWLVLQDR